MSPSTNVENASQSSPGIPLSTANDSQIVVADSDQGLPTAQEAEALAKLESEAKAARLANMALVTTGLVCVAAGIPMLLYYREVALLLFVSGGYLTFLSTSKSPTQVQKRELPKLAATRNPEALGPLCRAAFSSDRTLRATAEASLIQLIRHRLNLEGHLRTSETADLLKILTCTRNTHLIVILLDWIVADQPQAAASTLDRLAKSKIVRQNAALVEIVSECRQTVTAARSALHGRDDLLRPASHPSTQNLLRPVAPGKSKDDSHLLRPAGDDDTISPQQ